MRTHLPRTLFLIGALGALGPLGPLAACSKTSDKPDEPSAAASDKAPVDEPATPAKQPLTAAWLGTAVAPPGVLGKLTFGTPMEATLATAGFKSAAMTHESEIDGVSYGVSQDVDGVFTDSLLKLPADKKAVIEEAWGPGKDATRGGATNKVTVWFNPATGIRAIFNDEGNGKAYLRFDPYLPLTTLLGEGKPIAALAKPLLGLTPAEAAPGYPGLTDEKHRITLPPTEWEFGSGINVSPYPLDGKMESVAIKIPYHGRPEEKDAILAAFEAKWGPAKGEVKFNKDAKIYNAADPRIEITDNGRGYTIRFGGK